jgi:hypothetical protein
MLNIEDIIVTIKEMEDLQQDCKELFHYTSVSALENIVKDFEASIDKSYFLFRATNAFMTNDSLEMRLGYDYTLNLFSQFEECLTKNVNSDKYKISLYMNDVKNSVKFNIYSENDILNWMLSGENTPYIISLSRQNDDIDMWKYYGCNGHGVCFVFDSEALEQLIEQSGMFIHGPSPVIYGERMGYTMMRQNFIKMVFKLYRDYLYKVHPLTDIDKIAELKIRTIDEVCCLISVFIKSEDWHNERETRMAAIRHFDSKGEQPIIKQNEKGKSYFEIKMPINSLAQIIIGPCVIEKDVDRIKTFAKTLGISEENVIKSNKPLQ